MQPNTSATGSKTELEKAIQAFRGIVYREKEATIKMKGGLVRAKNQAIKIASLLIESTHQNGLPINLKPICERMAIHTIIEDGSLTAFSAELVPDQKGFVLRLAKTHNRARHRATIAHEIGHTLFYDSNRSYSRRILRYRAPTADKDKEEWIAWDFARALLLPKELFTMELDSNLPYPSVSGLVGLAKSFQVSVELFCHRAIRDLNSWDPCALFICERERSDVHMMKVQVYRTKNFPTFFVKGKNGLLSKSPELNAIIKKVSTGDSPTDGDFIEFEGIPLWATLLRYAERPQRILGVLEIPPLDYAKS